MDKRVREALRVAMAAIVALCCAAGIAGCGSASDEKAIREGVTELLEAFKNPTKENLGKYVDESDVSSSELESYGIDIYEFLGHCFSRYSYEIGDIEVSGDTATAEVKVTNVDLSVAIEEATKDLTERSDELAQKYADGSDDAMSGFMQEYFEIVYAKIDEVDQTVTTPVTLRLTKKDNEWNIDDDSEKELIAAMYGSADLDLLS